MLLLFFSLFTKLCPMSKALGIGKGPLASWYLGFGGLDIVFVFSFCVSFNMCFLTGYILVGLNLPVLAQATWLGAFTLLSG